MQAKLSSWAEEKGSPKAGVASRNCRLGERYWRMP
jgi:hypothetical protein